MDRNLLKSLIAEDRVMVHEDLLVLSQEELLILETEWQEMANEAMSQADEVMFDHATDNIGVIRRRRNSILMNMGMVLHPMMMSNSYTLGLGF